MKAGRQLRGYERGLDMRAKYLGLRGSTRGKQKWSHLGYILEVNLTILPMD